MYLPNISATSRIRHKVIFEAEYSCFEFRVFVLLGLSTAEENSLTYYLLIASDEKRIHGLPKSH